jgi:hypothetical protein
MKMVLLSRIVLLIIVLSLLTACNNHIDVNNTEQRAHGLWYIKGTNKLVDGEVVRKLEGKMIELHTLKDGKMIGPFFQYGPDGKVATKGFGIELKSYEQAIGGTDLTNCILSIVQVNNVFNYATVYMDNARVFDEKEKLLLLTKHILADYSDKYKIDGLFLFDVNHEYTVSANAANKADYIIDTALKTKPLKVNFR